MIGGILTSFILELVVYPPVYERWVRFRTGREEKRAQLGPDRQPVAQVTHA
jgi:hypothetical protein